MHYILLILALSGCVSPTSAETATLQACSAGTKTLYMAAALRQANKLTDDEISVISTQYVPVLTAVCIDHTSDDVSRLDTLNQAVEQLIFSHADTSKL